LGFGHWQANVFGTLLLEHLPKQMSRRDRFPYPRFTNPPPIIRSVMVKMTATTQHRQVARIVIAAVMIQVRQRQHFFCPINRMHLPMLNPATLTRPTCSGLA
jgi:3-hydroxyacyl-CoA dehydrogenase